MKSKLEHLYEIYNNSKYIQFDPLKYVYMFEDVVEIELVGLIASSLAFGRVTQIFKAIERLLEIMEWRPLRYVYNLGPVPPPELISYRYRFVNGRDIYTFLHITGEMIKEYGSIGLFMKKNSKRGDMIPLVNLFLESYSKVNFLIPNSLKSSACKRLFMYFRWMVRRDNIDKGLWDFIEPADLIIPLDTHTFNYAVKHGLTSKKTPSFKTARDVTSSLKEFCRNDPVKYDWAISHEGIMKNNFK